jgi:hypothetical protein
LATRLGAATRFGPSLNIPGSPPGALQQTGCLAGTATFLLTPAGPGPVSGSATYSGFDNCYFLPLNGTASVTGTLIGTTQVDSFTLTFSNFAYSTTHRAAGTIMLTWKLSVLGSAGYIMTIDATVSDASQNPLFKLDNFRIDSDVTAGLEQILVSGRLTVGQGFVDLGGANRLDLPFPSTGFQSGSLTMTGLSQIATVTYSGSGAFTTAIAPKP